MTGTLRRRVVCSRSFRSCRGDDQGTDGRGRTSRDSVHKHKRREILLYFFFYISIYLCSFPSKAQGGFSCYEVYPQGSWPCSAVRVLGDVNIGGRLRRGDREGERGGREERVGREEEEEEEVGRGW